MLEHGQVVLVVVRDEDERGGRHQRILADQLGRHPDLQLVHVGKPLLRREARPAVHHDGAVAEGPGQRRERHRHVAGAHDEQERGRGDDLHEATYGLEEERLRTAARHRVPRLGGEALVEERVAERALGRPVVEDQQLAAWRIETRDDGAVAAASRVLSHVLVHARAHVGRAVQRDRLDEHLDGAAAREADLPGVLVAEIHLEQPRPHGAQHVFRLLDHLRVDAAADGDGAEHASALAHQHLGALLARSGAASVDERGHGDAPAGASQFVNVIEEFRHGLSSYAQ